MPSMKGGGNVVSPYRWVILFTTIPVIIATEIMWLSLSPISSVAEEFYGVESLSITLFTMSYMIMFIIFSIPASFVIDRYGYRASLIIGALLTGIFGLTRGIFADSFAMVMISQFLIAAGQPFLLNITTKVAANWFPLTERATAAGLLTMAQYLGFAIPMALSPIIVTKGGIPSVLLVFGIIGAVCAVVSLLFAREKPAVPPPGPVAQREDFSLKTIKKLFSGKQYMITLFIAFISMGIFNTILTLIEGLLAPRGITSGQAGTIGAVFVIAGVLGAIVLPIISDKVGRRIPFLRGVLIALVPLYLGLSLLDGYGLLVAVAGLAGFSIMGAAPIMFQHGSEVAYPVQEGTSLGMILLMGQISGVVFVFLLEELMAVLGGPVIPMLVLVALNLLVIPVAFKMKESKMVK